jgi:hypothetical protein
MKGPGAPARALWVLSLLLVSGLVPLGLGAAAPAPHASPLAAGASRPLTAHLTGPSVVAVRGKADFYMVAFNGTAVNASGLVGNYTFTTQLLGPNTTGAFVQPPSGAFATNNQTFSVGSIPTPGTYTLAVSLTSHGPSGNETANFTKSFQVVTPYLLTATVYNPSNRTVTGASVQVLLDGKVVGSAGLTSLAPLTHATFTFNYTTVGLSPGDHTFTLVIQSVPGLLVFAGGGRTLSVTFYVQAPAANYTLDWEAGIVLAVLAIFISLLIVVPRRSRSRKNP